MDTFRVTAVIVTYQSAGTLAPTLHALKDCHDRGLMNSIVVDNASSDGTPALLLQQGDWLQTVLSPVNLGFGKGCNAGLAKVSADYTLFLNPDAEIKPEEVQKLIAFMDAHPQAGVCGPLTLVGRGEADARYQVSGRRMLPSDILRSMFSLTAARDLHLPILPGTAPYQTGWVCGAVFMVRTQVLQSLGGFDPRFFLYWEETDVCKRLEDAGYQVWAVPGAQATHIGGASSPADGSRIAGCISEHYYKSRRHYLQKHHGWLTATVVELAEFGLLALLSVADVLRGRGWGRILPRLQAPLFSLPDKV
jgi:GT2 family glycosyltransferase